MRSTLYFKAYNKTIINSFELNNFEKYALFDLIDHFNINGYYNITYGMKNLDDAETLEYLEKKNNIQTKIFERKRFQDEKRFSSTNLYEKNAKIVCLGCFEAKQKNPNNNFFQFIKETNNIFCILSGDSFTDIMISGINSGFHIL